ncbi:MAG: hypothetical protein EZS28_019064 [Streblomastix strix]|uniref:Uncharacterized protein n=1 Tax=Streblomastix strix TaxID=222440 RepID=A0A5J4VSK9_9EUKA|nr:MAG: hypothetical protein EZS28_019064 [Streblomastix strix]
MKENSPQDYLNSKICGNFSFEKSRFGEVARSERIEKRTIAPAQKFTTKQGGAFLKEFKNRYNDGYPFTLATFTELIQKDHPQKSLTDGYKQSMLVRRSHDIKSYMLSLLEGLLLDIKQDSAAVYVTKLMEDVY